MNEVGVDTNQFRGPGAVLALVLAHVRHDYWNAPKDSLAYKTAEQFLIGELCEHTICARCSNPDAETWWERHECRAEPSPDLEYCLRCAHPLSVHHVAEYDWEDWRDLIVGALGMDSDGFAAAVQAGRVGE